MAKDRNLIELNDYTFDIMRNAVAEGRDEFLFIYNERTYSIGIHSISKRRNMDPEWFCYDETGKKYILIDERENLIDNVIIDGKSLKEIWDDVIVF